MKKILFFQFDLNHFSSHIIPIAVELSRMENTVVYLAGFRANIRYIKSELKKIPNHNCKVKLMEQNWGRKIITEKVNGLQDLKYVYRRYRRFIESVDAIVSPSLHYCWVKKVCNLNNTKLIYTGHGIDVGSYGFGSRLLEFDLVLGVGSKWQQRLRELDLEPKGGSAIIGYPKFDLNKGTGNHSFFKNKNPVFLYNPHFQPKLTSWYHWGTDVLTFFKDHPEYNLIFAPHVTLFNLRLDHNSFPEEFLNLDNIHVDLGSNDSINMTYVNAADVYIGDVSSQVFEFLVEKRPCIFLNAQGVDWKDSPDYKHWNFGDVVEEIEHLQDAINSCFDRHKNYIEIQKTSFNEIFNLTEEPSGIRAARAILNYLK